MIVPDHIREEVLEVDGHQCAAYVNGKRCGNTIGIQVHYLLHPGPDEVENATALCEFHLTAIYGIARRLGVAA